jgi:hypothetical protein
MAEARPRRVWKGRHRGPLAVEAHRKLVEIGLEVIVPDAVMGAAQPGLEVGCQFPGAQLYVTMILLLLTEAP